MAKRAFEDKKNLINKQEPVNQYKNEFMQCYAWSALLYGCESWPLSKRPEAQRHRLLQPYRDGKGCCGYHEREKISNDNVLGMVGQ